MNYMIRLLLLMASLLWSDCCSYAGLAIPSALWSVVPMKALVTLCEKIVVPMQTQLYVANCVCLYAGLGVPNSL